MRHPDRPGVKVKLPNKHRKATYSIDTQLFRGLLRTAGVTKAEFVDAYFSK